MELFMIEEDEIVYRVRKEDEGCTIFSSSSYIEGNDILYIILKEISDYGVTKAIDNLIEKYQCPEIILNDLIQLSKALVDSEILLETANCIIKICTEKSGIQS